jgi:hypothetical protein
MKQKKIGKVSILGRIISIFKTVQMPIEDTYGLYYMDERKIVLNETINPDVIVEIFYHEMWHAAMDRAGLYQTGMSNDMHEILCELFRNVVTDNFELKDKKLLRELKKQKPLLPEALQTKGNKND